MEQYSHSKVSICFDFVCLSKNVFLLFFFFQHQQTLLNQLREVTGTTDVQLLQQALQVNYRFHIL